MTKKLERRTNGSQAKKLYAFAHRAELLLQHVPFACCVAHLQTPANHLRTDSTLNRCRQYHHLLRNSLATEVPPMEGQTSTADFSTYGSRCDDLDQKGMIENAGLTTIQLCTACILCIWRTAGAQQCFPKRLSKRCFQLIAHFYG